MTTNTTPSANRPSYTDPLFCEPVIYRFDSGTIVMPLACVLPEVLHLKVGFDTQFMRGKRVKF